jgi:hypothetical protein
LTQSHDRTYLLGALSAAVRGRDLFIAEIDDLIVELRDAGATWQQIGDTLGVTRSTAQRIYSADRERYLEGRREAQKERSEFLRQAGYSTV